MDKNFSSKDAITSNEIVGHSFNPRKLSKEDNEKLNELLQKNSKSKEKKLR